MLQDLAFHKIADPPDPGPGLSLVHRTISAAGEALFLYVDAAVEPRVFAKEQDAAGARFPVSVMDDPAGFTLMVLDAGGSARRIELPGVDISCPMAALFPDGRVLLAGARSWWRGPEDFDLNGVIYDPADGSTRRLHLGDGISDVVIDTQGRIWVGYFDEGVFGNLGWSHPGPTGLGAAGLVALDDHGEVLWRFNEDQTPFISDCYALNVHGSEAWAYYYTDFEVARVDGAGRPDVLGQAGVFGAGALAVSDQAVLLSAQYREPGNRFHLVRRAYPGFAEPEPIEAVAPADILSRHAPLGRGPHMHILHDQGWFRADMRELSAG